MATFDLPPALYPGVASFGLQKSGWQFAGPFNGSVQSVESPGERWVMSLTTVPKRWEDSGVVEAFFARLSGGVHRLRMFHPRRYQPIGTLRGSPQLQTGVARGALTLILSNCTVGATLEPGDMLGFASGDQLLQVAESAIANGGGVMTVQIVNRVRAAIAGGSPATWSRPTALFQVPAQAFSVVHQPGFIEGATVDLQEAWT